MLLLSLAGCHRKAPVPAAPTPAAAPAAAPVVPQAPEAIIPEPPEPAPEETPAPEPGEAAEPTLLEVGTAQFQAGDYALASQSLEAFLLEHPKSPDREHALYLLGLSRAVAQDSGRDLVQAEAALRRLIAEFPQSAYRRQAEYVLRLHARIERLTAEAGEREERIRRLEEELERLKAIDLGRKPGRIGLPE
jgi:TolA-binding protein